MSILSLFYTTYVNGEAKHRRSAHHWKRYQRPKKREAKKQEPKKKKEAE